MPALKVFIADFDLFKNIGGGQTFYKRIIETNPDISFCYLIRDENPNASRPLNATPILFKENYFQEKLRAEFVDFEPPPWTYYDFALSSNIAYSIAGMQFDIFDYPDYHRYGYFIRIALKHHDVRVDRIALSMHGNLSTSEYHNWYRYKQRRYDHEQGEKWQYELADLRYSISRDYVDEWHQKVPIRANYLNPLLFVERATPVLAAADSEPPGLVFVGRTERRKGPHIFIDMIAELPRKNYSRALLVGPGDGNESSKIVSEYISNREVGVEMVGPKSGGDIKRLFSEKVINIVPSTYDTFNLVALESLFMGCPTVVSTSMGIYRFLRESLPEIPFLPLTVSDYKQCVSHLNAMLLHYEAYRAALVSSFERISYENLGVRLSEIYQSVPCRISCTEQIMNSWYAKLYNCHVTRSSKNKEDDNLRLPSQLQIAPHLNSDFLVNDQFSLCKFMVSNYHKVSMLPEEVSKDIEKKLEYYGDVSTRVKFDRARVWQEIARLENVRDNRLNFVTYALRVMRATGDDVFGILPQVCSALREEGYAHEADAACAMYSGGEQERYDACLNLLNDRYRRHMTYVPGSFSLIDDGRDKDSYKVSVIVSLYNAAEKIAHFVSLLQKQTLMRHDEVEVIFVETGSPAGDYHEFKKLKPLITFPVVYARTDERETIQSAWNRGISLSRGGYLAFLGVDEYISPDCLQLLADELDRDPGTDWIIGNSLVTDVDEEGNWLKDVMMYDRTGLDNGTMYLESCYLSYVGALYRKSIHTRFGYYDSAFRGAGDTEFKCRILPHINIRSVPHTLGYFMNYPDDRMTNSPRAEVEDLRAWYLHRTPAGVRYAFGNKSANELESMVLKALQYRKSYCKHMSSDVEYAYNLMQLLHQKAPHSPAMKYLAGIKELFEEYRAMDLFPPLGPNKAHYQFVKCIDAVSRVEQEHQMLGYKFEGPIYRIFNDNRYEQHHWVWSRDNRNDAKYEKLVSWDHEKSE